MGCLISLVNFHEVALQSIWWRDISKDSLFEPLQAKFQPERTHSSRLVVTFWSEIGVQKSALPPSNAPSYKSTVAMTKLRIGLWIDSSSTLFSGFDPVWLLSVPKLKNLVRWEEILVKWESHCRRQWIFCRLWDSLLWTLIYQTYQTTHIYIYIYIIFLAWISFIFISLELFPL